MMLGIFKVDWALERESSEQRPFAWKTPGKFVECKSLELCSRSAKKCSVRSESSESSEQKVFVWKTVRVVCGG